MVLPGPDHYYYGEKRRPYEVDPMTVQLVFARLESDGNAAVSRIDDSMKLNVSNVFARIQHYAFT